MKAALLIFDLLFYAYMLKGTSVGYAGVVILLALSFISWILAAHIYDRKSKAALAAGAAVNVAVLASFKYLAPGTGLLMPVGLSFYVFQLISLLADSYCGRLDERPSLLDTFLYAGFFVTITSGPIIKAADFMRDIRKKRTFDRARTAAGVWRILRGLFEKMVVADRLGIAVDAVYSSPEAYSGLSLLAASVTFSLQIYFDFAGYSNVAIGVGQILGFDIPENFNLPYMAKDPSDFWRRWHISLSSWLREYIYIPLGGSRKGKGRTLFNIMATMLISGIWHGSTINFLLWGGLHGVWQVLHRVLRKERTADGRIVRILKITATFIAVNFLWIPFRTADLKTTASVVGRILAMAPGVTYSYSYTLIFGVMLILYQIYMATTNGGSDRVWTFDLAGFKGKVIFISAVLAILLFAYFGNTAFIYQNF